MAFQDLISGVIDQFSIDPAWFGETVTYTPVGGTARDIGVKIRYEEDLNLDGIDTETRFSQIQVLCKRDATDGIDLPNLGDTIVRSATYDRDDRPYLFHAMIGVNTRDHWRLTFVRKRRDTQGFR